jgi:hypothetical protein
MNTQFKDLFISYGRRESLGFVGRLHQQLKLAGYDAWFDKVNIPNGDDYAQRINQGIESTHNIVYVMAPRCLTSPYCLMELEYARFLGKRVIPINHMVIFNTTSRALSDGDKQALADFYQPKQLSDPHIQTTQQVLKRSLVLIGRTDWLDAKEHLTDDDCQHLEDWARPYENHWTKHDDLDYLKTLAFPIFGEAIDTLRQCGRTYHHCLRKTSRICPPTYPNPFGSLVVVAELKKSTLPPSPVGWAKCRPRNLIWTQDLPDILPTLLTCQASMRHTESSHREQNRTPALQTRLWKMLWNLAWSCCSIS